MIFIYFLIAIFATTIGAMVGLGGGVIIKPVLDIFGHFDAGSISMLSSITVFAMSIVSLANNRKSPERPQMKMAVPLAIGAVIGGTLGSSLLDYLLTGSPIAGKITAIQNTVLALLIVGIFFFLRNKEKVRTLKLEGIIPSATVGLVLGTVSSFLGIGGGPINVAIILFAFSLPAKTSTICSLIIIFFSQASKLATTALTSGFSSYDLSMLIPMIIGGVAGGFLGSKISKKLSEKATVKMFSAAQVLIFLICVVNIARSLM